MLVAQSTRVLCAITASVTLLAGSLAQAAEAVPAGLIASVERAGLGTSAQGFLLKRRPSKKKPLLTPESAEEKRQAIREAARPDLDTERWAAAADTLESNAVILGDPVTLLEAGKARLQHADRERSIEEAERAIETTRVAVDILHFYRSVAAGEATSDWLVIDPDDTHGHMARAAEQIAAAQTLIETIERERAGDDGIAAAPDAPKKDRSMRPGTGMIVAGAAATTVGVAGVSMVIAGVAIGASKQSEVEDLVPGVDDDAIDRLDEEGARANRVAFIGTGLAVVGLAVGIPLIAFGLKKRRASSGSAAAHLQVLPALGPAVQGVTFSGRF